MFATKSWKGLPRTHRCWVLAKVLGLVLAQDSSSLDLGGRASGQLLVEGDDTLHGDAIGVGAKCLDVVMSASFSPSLPFSIR